MRGQARRTAATSLALAVVVALPFGAPARPAAAGGAADPGVTPTQVVLGATAPLSGPDAAAAAVSRGVQAYLRYVNARGGVHGRRIDYRVVDDGGDPAAAAEATRALVDEGVLALVGSVGTEQALAARDRLNAAGVPQLFVASAAATLGREAARYRWTVGFPPSGRAEGRIYGRYLAAARPGARVAVLTDGGEDARDLLVGLRQGVARSTVTIVGTRAGDVAALARTGATVLALFAAPDAAVEAAVEARRLGWSPLVVSASRIPVAGAITLAYAKDPADPRWATDPGMRLYRTIMARYARGADRREAGHVEGMALAYAAVEALTRAGRTPTRAGLLARARTMRSVSSPFLLPGVVVRTGPGDGFPVEQGRLERREGGSWRPLGGLWAAAGG